MEDENNFEEIHKKRKENLKMITDLLIHFEKEFSIEYWGSGDGVDIIINELEVVGDFETKEYQQVLGLNDSGYLTFEKQEINKGEQNGT